MNSFTEKRHMVLNRFTGESLHVKSDKISLLTPADLKILFCIYDETFFDNWFSKNYKGKMIFTVSRKMIKTAGKTMYPKNDARIKPENIETEIRISLDFFAKYGVLGSRHTVCGITAESSLEALLLVFEHELCHAYEFIKYHNSSCSNKRFREFAGSLFGHTESFHKMPTNLQVAEKMLGLTPGCYVTFDFDGRKMQGIIYRINKRATVMVQDPKGIFKDNKGIKYTKYYVPLTKLAKVQTM